MIQPLRRAHFRVWVVLTAALWLLFAISITMRHETTPLNQNLNWESLK